jgi:hypothetical protein
MPRPPSLPAPVLDQIVRQIAEDHAATPHASLIRVRPTTGGVDVRLCALPPGVHPAEALVGHIVPSRWAATGVVAPAHARPLDQAGAAGTGTPTTVAMLVGRDGHVTSCALDAGIEAGGEAPIGRIPDLLLRTIGLPTPPPPVDAVEWWRAHWLDALVSVAADEPGAAPEPGQALTGTLAPELVHALVAEPELTGPGPAGWARMRALAAAADPPTEPGPAAIRQAITPFVDPAVAAWMDDGCFARWLLDALPTVDELLELAAALVTPGLLHQLRQVSGRRGDEPKDPLLPPAPPLDEPPEGPPEGAPGEPAGEPAPQGARGSSHAPR